jgi:hypothetical protein
MATSKNNVLTHGLSGTIGDLLVFRNKGNQVIVASRPKERSTEYSESEKAHQQRFQRATIYGRTAVADPNLKADYIAAAKEGQTAYNVAVADFFHAPDIDSIDISGYTGKVGEVIKIKVTDDFKVSEVKVSIYNADGTEVEHGTAVQSNFSEWVFTAQVANASVEGDRIEVKAYDLPGNESLKEING